MTPVELDKAALEAAIEAYYEAEDEDFTDEQEPTARRDWVTAAVRAYLGSVRAPQTPTLYCCPDCKAWEGERHSCHPVVTRPPAAPKKGDK